MCISEPGFPDMHILHKSHECEITEEQGKLMKPPSKADLLSRDANLASDQMA